MNFFTNIDHNIIYWLNSINFPTIIDNIMKFFTHLGDYGLFWILIALVFIFKKQLKTGASLFTSLTFSLISVNLILKPLFQRLRPFEALNNINLLISAPGDYSFPSGHTTAAFICFFTIVLTCKNKLIKYLSFVIAFLIGFSRIYLKVHFLSDVLAGVVVALLLSLLSVYLINKTTLTNKTC